MSQTVFERYAPQKSTILEALAPSVNRPFWLDDVAQVTKYPRYRGPSTFDLAIVGGGYLGLWTAILAKERNPNRSVILLEGQNVGWAASGRNGGFCDASLTHGEENGRARWPEEYEALDSLGRQNLNEIEAAIERYSIDCEFERTGALTVATEPYQEKELRGEGYLSGEEVQQEVSSPTYLAGVWDKDSVAMLHPAKLVMELARVATELGVKIFERSPITGIEPPTELDNGRVHLRTAAGPVSASRVVLATNAFPSLLKRYRFHTVPVYDYALMTEPLTSQQMDSIGWKNRQGISDMANQFHYYRLSRDNRILFGGYDAIYNYGGRVDSKYDDRPQSFERLASHFFTTFPQLEGVTFTHRWGGAIDSSTQFCAFYGQAREGKIGYASGFTGLGVGATRFAANVLLDRIEGLHTERTALRMVREVPLPFPPEPFAYAGVQATRWSMDQADHNQGKRNFILRTLDKLGLGFDS
ncbi:FAD-dependent oxidoreductase [Lysinibacter sp. HNR]|uniref:NAD(P)/FAD-dependent oxidoreductase n=1 Tax=Lysinibacter sp. HNR TaxID=3031408 RepID=UPI002434CC3C|nr:FAD-dependent oxidoreductase [Lysinibacter sp. HNR]WGD38232.1 FAD-dependent oxidoreductase [Lysinibacter sp. HNR]